MSPINFKIVHTPEEQLQAFSIRTLVYIGEQNCPWDEEFDGNDYSATHVLGTVGGEPAAAARLRFFGTFAKLERLSIRQVHRGQGFGHDLLTFLIHTCREKAFTKLYLHAQARLVPFYQGYGFEPRGEGFGFSDHDYVEMEGQFPLSASAVTLECGPLVLNRPEGDWRRTGVLERSVERMSVHASQLAIPAERFLEAAE